MKWTALCGEHVGRVVRRLVPVVDEVAVVVDRVVVVLLHRDAVHDLPVVPARRDGVVDVGVGVGVEVLADERRLVAGVVHPDPEVVRRVLEGREAVRPEVLQESRVMRVLAGEDAGPRRPTEGRRHVRVGEGHPVVGEQLLDVLHDRRPVRALVVAQDQDDVEPLVGGMPARLGRRRTDRAEDEQQRPRHPDPEDPPHERLQSSATCYALGKTAESPLFQRPQAPTRTSLGETCRKWKPPAVR